MVYHAVSTAGKRAQKRRTKDEKMATAVQIYLQNEALPATDPARRSARAIANENGVNRGTMVSHASGGMSMSAFNALKQTIYPAEETIVLDFAEESAAIGFPPTGGRLIQAAQAILRARTGGQEVLGPSWLDHFLTRNRARLQGLWGKSLDTQRAAALNPTVVSHWFRSIVKPNIVDDPVPPERIGGMDEVGVQQADSGKERVYGSRGTKTQHKTGGGSKKQNTVLASILGDGTALRPIIVFPGQNIQKRWNNNNVAHA
jgi:hypothetical protein